jgi:hypothetical protein
MPSVLAVLLLFLSEPAAPEGDPWVEIRLTIARDPYTSSDEATLCRVRVVNLGGRSWSGKSLRFEARARSGSRVVRQRGRFGLELPPYGSLETLVALPGRHDRIEVVPLKSEDDAFERDRSTRRKSTRHKSKKGGGS